MSICLLEELQNGEYETAMFLTYTINLRFFELMILPRLKRMGVSRIGILIDQKGYQDSLIDPLAPQLCGREYVLSPICLPQGGIQHAKLIWLQKHEKITAYIGSHNLTMSGFSDQVEVTAKLISTNPGHVQALCDLHKTVSSVISPSLNYVWKHTASPPAGQGSPTAKVLTSLNRSLFDQIVETVQVADKLRVITPFLDATALKNLTEAIHAKTILLDLPKEGADTPLYMAVKAVPTLQPRYLKDKRLHAKAYQFTTVQTSWLAIGSANCTQAALMRSVVEGGNLEMLLLQENTSLPDEEFDFISIVSPGDFPNTGRNWDAGPALAALIIIEEVFYKDGQLTVKWRLHENTDLLSVAIDVDGRSIGLFDSFCGTIQVSLEQAPQSVTLEAASGRNISQTKYWVINYDALEKKVSQAMLHQWVERIASEDSKLHADSVKIWLEQGIQGLLQGHHEIESGPLQPWSRSIQKQEKTQSKDRFYEVFAYSSDPADIRSSATVLLTSHAKGDPLVLLRVLLIRFAVDPSLDVTENTKDDDAYDATMQRYLANRKAATQTIVRHLIHQLDRLAKAEVNWNSVPEQDFSTGIRILLGAVAHICLSIVEIIPLKDAEELTENFICFVEWLTSLSAKAMLMQQIQFKGPFLLSFGAVARIAERCKEPTLYPRLQKASKIIFSVEDPRSVITTWKKDVPEDADRFLTLLKREDTFLERGDLWQQIEPYSLRLLGIIPDHLKQKIKHRWGLLLALQEADIHSNPQRENLYEQAKAKYFGEEIWICYDEARRRNRLPVIFQTNREVCSSCYQVLPERKRQQFRVGEMVVCDNCHQILLLK